MNYKELKVINNILFRDDIYSKYNVKSIRGKRKKYHNNN